MMHRAAKFLEKIWLNMGLWTYHQKHSGTYLFLLRKMLYLMMAIYFLFLKKMLKLFSMNFFQEEHFIFQPTGELKRTYAKYPQNLDKNLRKFLLLTILSSHNHLDIM